MVNSLILDFDGTLAATEILSLSIYNELAEKRGYRRFTENEVAEMKQLHWKEAIRHSGVPFKAIPGMLKQGHKLLKGQMASQELSRESIPIVLGALRPKLSLMGIISSNAKKNIEVFLEAHAIEHLDFVISSPLFTKAAKIKKALKKYKVSAESALYVGDEIRDIQAAREAGIRVAVVTWGFNTEALLETESPDYIINDFSELLEIVGN